MTDSIRIEVVYALPERQEIVALDVPAGTTLREAVELSGIAGRFPSGEIDIAHAVLGVFGKLEKHPERRVLADGDRVEIYRPLRIDPNSARLRRAARRR